MQEGDAAAGLALNFTLNTVKRLTAEKFNEQAQRLKAEVRPDAEGEAKFTLAADRPTQGEARILYNTLAKERVGTLDTEATNGWSHFDLRALPTAGLLEFCRAKDITRDDGQEYPPTNKTPIIAAIKAKFPERDAQTGASPGPGPDGNQGPDAGEDFSAPIPGKDHVLYKIGEATKNSYHLHLLLQCLEENAVRTGDDAVFIEEVMSYASQVAQAKKIQMPRTPSQRYQLKLIHRALCEALEHGCSVADIRVTVSGDEDAGIVTDEILGKFILPKLLPETSATLLTPEETEIRRKQKKDMSAQAVKVVSSTRYAPGLGLIKGA